MATLSVRGLTKRFENGVVAVDGISFDVQSGELVTLLGPSGCGKTTTLRMVAGLERPDAGDVMMGAETLTSAGLGVFVAPERRQAAMVFQSYAIWPHMTVFDNVAFPLKARKIPRAELQERVAQALDLLGLTGLDRRLGTQLSGGQQQRVAIARAIVAEPRLLLLDEPLSNLDARLRARMRVELGMLQKRLGMTTIYVTHDQVEAMVLSDRVMVMQAGRIVQVGTPRDIYRRPASQFVADFMGFVNFFDGVTVEASGQGPVVQLLPDGPVLRCERAGPVPLGVEVIVAARASTLVPTTTPPADPTNVLQGTVRAAAYLGEAMEYQIDGPQGPLIAAVEEARVPSHNGRALSVGDTVHVVVNGAELVVLPR